MYTPLVGSSWGYAPVWSAGTLAEAFRAVRNLPDAAIEGPDCTLFLRDGAVVDRLPYRIWN